MSLNEKIFLYTLKNLQCFENKPYVAVGVSGGPDSMALLHLVNYWTKLKKGKLVALIFDHCIRDDSRKESYLVKDMVNNLNIDAYVIKPKKNTLIKRNMANARANRLEGLINYCKKNLILHLFLGHHFDDNLETYLIRKINGSNIEGLKSMIILSNFNNTQIVRPLINIRKSSILKYNKKHNIKFINDPSNKDVYFTRVKVRNFLQNKNYKKLVQSDFKELKKQIPYYKQMIWELLIDLLIEIKPSKIKISSNKLLKLHDLIIEKHVLILLGFLSNNKKKTKGSKIRLFIDSIKKSNFKVFYLSNVIIQKKSDFLIFSQK